MPQTTAVDSASAMVRPPCLRSSCHRIRAVAPHPGHQHSHQMRRVIVLKRAGHHPSPRWDARDSRVAPEPAWRSIPVDRGCHDQISVAPADIDSAGLQRHRPIHLDHAQLALASSRLANGPVKLAGICCATSTGQGNRCGQLRKHDIERGGSTGRGSDQNQSPADPALPCFSARGCWTGAGRARRPAPRN